MVERANRPSALASAPASLPPQPHVELSKDEVTATLPDKSSVKILLHGATVTSWKSASGNENLFLSDAAVLDGSKPVRGGIPVVFPVFGPPPSDHATSKLPQHGFARSSKWEFLGKSFTESSGVKLDFGLDNTSLGEQAKAQWPHAFGLQYSVTLSPGGELRTMLNVRNTGDSAWEFQTLLHTYFRIPSISTTAITGLLGTEYVDKVLNASTYTESKTALPITGEVDRGWSQGYRDMEPVD
ncbi:hypothetical protein FH972_023333 [Carpinus fangiana]|uniref:glucose-6-phosphate 1-epimerase n=1 Tax=Carpinus fangiana TaxID=176857 RepID=A0A5N6KUX3_9ROSI|nr:hypothetical protein FH972_023333 [Carpinus fangiana]